VNEGTARCVTTAIVTGLRSVVWAALAAIVLVTTLTGLARPAPASASASAGTIAAASLKLRIQAWRYAMRQGGKPYVWGGTGPDGFDCSGLVYASYRSARLPLPRTTSAMLRSWHLVRITKSQAQRGDLAFFGTGHVELYDRGNWTYGAADSGTRIGFHLMNSYWHPTMYFRVRW